jgi:hypothetical protein
VHTDLDKVTSGAWVSIARGLFFAFIAAPSAGAVIGLFVGTISFAASGESGNLGASFGIPIGAIFGLLNGCASVFLIRRNPLFQVVKYLTAGTCLGALPFIFVPQYGAFLSIVSAHIGFWFAVALLRVSNKS